MTPPSRRRLILDLRQERGATVVIVALVLVAMFGMMVLVVDVGGLLWKRRELVNGSDAAALSAASTCALPTSVDPKTAEQAADPLAAQNVTGLDPTTSTNATVLPSTCHTAKSGGVKVQYSQQQHLFFAPVLGFSNQNGVTTKAYAVWGPAGAANPVPIVVYTSTFQGSCNVGANLPPKTPCYMWYDNDRFTNSAFGFLNLNASDPQKGWDVGAADQCPNVGASTRNGWIDQTGSVADLPVHYSVTNPLPTYVCRVSGLSSSDWDTLRSRVNDVVTFPMDDCTQNVDQNGSVVGCAGTPDKYDIIGFIDFTLVAVLDQATGPNGWGGIAQQNCSFTAKKVPNTAPNNVVSLLGQSPIGQCPQSDPTVPSPPGGGLVNLTVNGQPPGATYTYDAVTQTITWNGADQTDLNISFDWWMNGQCGQPPKDSSAVCIKVVTEAVHVGGSNPCPTCSPLSNIRAVKLCDPAVTGSCNGINVPT